MFALGGYVEEFSTTAKLNFGWHVRYFFLGLRELTSGAVIGSVSYTCEAEMKDIFLCRVQDRRPLFLVNGTNRCGLQSIETQSSSVSG